MEDLATFGVFPSTVTRAFHLEAMKKHSSDNSNDEAPQPSLYIKRRYLYIPDMRSFIPLLLILGAALCFAAGYTVGKKHRYKNNKAPLPIAAESVPIEKPATDLESKIHQETAPPSKTVEAPEVAPDNSRFLLRAQQRIVTLSDTTERSLQGEILDVTETYLKVRRQSDLYIVQVPLDMLCEEDKAFASYLYNDKNDKQASSNKTQADLIWDEIFKDM